MTCLTMMGLGLGHFLVFTTLFFLSCFFFFDDKPDDYGSGSHFLKILLVVSVSQITLVVSMDKILFVVVVAQIPLVVSLEYFQLVESKKYFVLKNFGSSKPRIFNIVNVCVCLAHYSHRNYFNTMPRHKPVGDIFQTFKYGSGGEDGVEFIPCVGGQHPKIHEAWNFPIT